jgi:chemotaxis protein CheX
VSENTLPQTAVVESIVTDVFAGQLGVLDPPQREDAAGADGPEVVATVSVRGMWEGAVTLGCTSACARTVAGLMFGAEAGELSADDIADATGELVNIVGGNVKSLMPGPSRLSLPLVSLHGGGADEPSGPVLTLPMRWRGQILTVEITSAPIGRAPS